MSAAPLGPSPAALAALRDANAMAPERSRVSDGIMGDTSHQARPSDHNTGMAVDITHDPAHGCDAGQLAALAIGDPRAKYVIWARRIWSRQHALLGWRPYLGPNPHTHHVHISILPHARDDARPWPWSPEHVDAAGAAGLALAVGFALAAGRLLS